VRIGGKERNVHVWAALAGFVLLAGIGIVNLRNADLYSQDQYHYSQVIWILIGGVGAVIAAKIDFIVFERLSWVVYGGVVALLVAVDLFGIEVNNSTRWIDVFGITMQPSEPAKVGVILALASYFQRSKRTERYTLRSLWKPFLIIAVPSALVLVQPDLGTTLCIIFIGVSVILFAGVRTKSLLLLAGWIGLAVPIAWQTDIILPYQKDRVALWLNPDQFKWDENRKERLDKNMQPEQALWAIGSGRLLGKGGGQGSRSRLKVLPEMQTDFILATFAEERGFVGCFFLVGLYYALVVWGLGVARDARDRFSALVATGVSFAIFWQSFMNIGMVTGVLPVVGVTLPMMSYGGSSMLTSLFGVGLLFNVALHMRKR